MGGVRARLVFAGVVFLGALAWSAAQAGDIGSVGGIRGSLTTYSASTGSAELPAPSKNELIGRRIVGEENGRYAIDYEGTPIWVDKFKVSISRQLDIPRGCQTLAGSFSGSSSVRSAGQGCEE